MDMVNGNSLETWGYGVDLARYIRNRWEGELEEDQVKSRFSKLERQLIEIAHAKQYDDEGNYNRDRAVPVNLEPGSYRHRYDYNTAKIWNRQLYVIGFKEGGKNKGLRVRPCRGLGVSLLLILSNSRDAHLHQRRKKHTWSIFCGRDITEA